MNNNNNSENFTLHDFFKITGETLEERVAPFSDTLSEYTKNGWTLYSRELISAPGPRVTILDSLTNQPREMVMMGSNDYLGLSHHPLVKKRAIETIEKFGVGMGGPPLLNGMSQVHRDLEQALAHLKGTEDAMIFSSGFQANIGWVTALLRSGDFVLYDELNHASFYDGLLMVKATRKIKAHSFSHNNTEELEALLKRARESKKPEGQIFVVVEGVYSMDGDLAPLPRICDLCETYGATLVVDDAHGTGVMGPHGGGTSDYFGVSHRVGLSMGTFSKSFGVTGGFISGSKKVIDYLRFFSRSYIFSAHLPQAIASAVLAGIEIIERQPELRKLLHENVNQMISGLRKLGIKTESHSAIIPIRTPQPVDLRLLNRDFHENGLFVNAIEYPAVALSEQRIRVSLMATHTKEDIDFALELFARLGRKHGLIP